MRVFIAGASGAVGRALIPRLLESGHAPIAMIRSREHEPGLREMGASTVVADGLDAGAVTRAVSESSPDVVVHVMTALKGVSDYKNFDRSFEPTNRLRTAGTDNLIAAARAAGVRRIVAHSFAGWNYARDGAAAKRETDPLDAHPPAHQRASMQALLHLERAVLENGGISGVVLRCANLYGPGTGIAPGGNVVALVRKRQMPIVGAGTGVWSFVHVDGAAAATVAAIDRDAAGVYNIADDEPAPTGVWIPELAEILHAPKPMRVPAFIGRLAAGEVGVSMMTRVRGVANAKAREQLGWRPAYRTWRDGFRSVLAPEAALTAGSR
jgi:nucleoside-diphosphate-sugar epimerase